MILVEQLLDIEQRLAAARRAGNLRLAKALEPKLQASQDAYMVQIQRSCKMPTPREIKVLRKVLSVDTGKRFAAKFARLNRDLKDLANFKAPPIGDPARRDLHKLMVKHLRKKSAARVAVKGGQARGKQKHEQARPLTQKVETMHKQGKGTKEIADRLGISQRRVQQILKLNRRN